MGILIGGDGALHAWQGGWQTLSCPLSRVDLVAAADGHITEVDNTLHLLWHGGRLHPCSRDIEALHLWRRYALLLSSDTDSLTLWDDEGLLRSAPAGVYPQDMRVHGDTALICGGADSRLHLLSLPELLPIRDYIIPGMPERLALRGTSAFVLSLLPDPDVHTSLLHADLNTGEVAELMCFPGIPGALAADDHHLWLSVSEKLLCLAKGRQIPDLTLEWNGLARHLDLRDGMLLMSDPLEGVCALCRNGSVLPLMHGDVGQAIFTA